ncbi:MAG: NUDIX hydrolase [Anaerolineae bacterium]|nr:NUDIX hydrolase [Anaerolineae bacterium]
MSNHAQTAVTWRHNLARTLRRNPWVIAPLLVLYRWTRPKYTLGVAGVVFNERRQVLLVEHVLHPRTPWGLPGGWVDAHEAPSTTVVREISEEVGIAVEVGAVLSIDEWPDIQHLDMIYLCVAQAPVEVIALSTELLSYGWHDVEAMPKIEPYHRAAIFKAVDILKTNGQWGEE